MGPSTRLFLLLLLFFIQYLVIAQTANDATTDYNGLQSLKDELKNTPPNWVGADPCGGNWGSILQQGITGQLKQFNRTTWESSSIGNLTNLTILILIGCSFSGPIPDTIGNLQQLTFLSLTNNSFSGQIPASIGSLSNLYWLDLADNQLEGSIPVSNGTTPGLDMLFKSKALSSGNEQAIRKHSTSTFQLKNDSNTFVSFFTTIISVATFLIPLDNNLSGNIPDTLRQVQTLEVIRIDRNLLSGPVPSNLSNLSSVGELHLSNNNLNGSIPDLTGMNSLNYVDMSNNTFNGSEIPPWASTLESLTTLMMENTQLEGQVPVSLFSLPNLQTVLMDNPICGNNDKTYCMVSQSNNGQSYSTPSNNCQPISCSLASVSLSNPYKDSSEQLEISLQVFPSGQDRFNETGISLIAFVLSNQIFKPPDFFGPFYFRANAPYEFYTESKKSMGIGIIIGAAAGGTVLLLLLLLAGVYAFRQKRRAERASDQLNPFANWDLNSGSGGIPQLKGARCFSFEELKKYTNKFSEANSIGSGGYGKVYLGTLPIGQPIAIKRAQKESMQGGHEFKTEIELLSRVHHKNLVSLVGFCFDQGEQMLVYEFVPNGTLKDSLSGKSGIRLDWMRRLKVALGAARGLAYLHELANPPIIHRDIKSTNILLDERLVAKVADFGLSKPMSDDEKDHVTTQVKGTMGYLDPEYYMTQQLTEKSDVYSFGVVMLELITARMPIERGKYIVKVVQTAMDKTKVLFNLHEVLDPAIGLQTSLKGLEKFVDLAMSCVEEAGANRPAMGDVVKEIENIMQLAGLNPNAESSTTSAKL
uniref:non-specific serine/threonine protein kinase n=1 Tax=Fagus sylvatica TaxID=28930 RepID=A0A2N9F957_FAGSY